MEPVIVVAVLWLLFGGTHIGLAVAPLRGRLVARLGEIGFVALFYLVAAASFAALVSTTPTHRFDGPAGPRPGRGPAPALAAHAASSPPGSC